MNTLEKPTIEEEIIFLGKEIFQQKYRIRSTEPTFKHIPRWVANLRYLEEKRELLKSLLAEQKVGWEIVFLQPQNDHDEVWRNASPGPRIAKRVPESQKLEFLIPEKLQTPSILGISFMLYQVQRTLSSVYEESKLAEQHFLKRLSHILACVQEIKAEDLESDECYVKKQTDGVRKVLEILDPRIEFLKGVIRHYECVLQDYARLAMFSRFENLESFLSEPRIVTEKKDEPLLKGHLSINIQSITGTSETGICFTLEPYDRWDSRLLSTRYVPHYVEWTGTEMSLEYDDVDTRTEIELMIYDKHKTKSPVGALWLRLIDILHSGEATEYQDDNSTIVDTWFTLAPKGKVRLKLAFTEKLKVERTLKTKERDIKDFVRYKLGHDFVYLKFYYSMLCTYCHKYFDYGMQCKKCQMACHLDCCKDLGRPPGIYVQRLFNVRCLDVPKTERHDPNHQFVPLFNVSANWCCHCGYYLSPGQGNFEGANRRCEKCGLTCHAQCQALLELHCDETALTEKYRVNDG